MGDGDVQIPRGLNWLMHPVTDVITTLITTGFAVAVIVFADRWFDHLGPFFVIAAWATIVMTAARLVLDIVRWRKERRTAD